MTLLWQGEGYHGPLSVDPEDEDRPVLRYLVHARKDGSWAKAASGTTYLLASDPREELLRAAKVMLATLRRHERKPDPFIWTTLSYIHMGGSGPQIEVPLDSKCRSFTD